MKVFSGTVFTITNGRETSRVTLQANPITVDMDDWEISERDMEGTWRRFNDGNNLHMPGSGYWHQRWMPTMGSILFLVDQKGRPVLMLNMEGTKERQGRGVLHFHYGPGQGQKICGFPDIPEYPWAKLWYGVGFKTGGQLAVLGYETAAAWMMNFGSQPSGSIVIDGIRLGAGLGGSAGATIVLAFNYASLRDALGSSSGQFDFALSLGKKWSGLLKGLPGTFAGLKEIAAIGQTVDSLDHLAKVGKRLQAIENFAAWAKVLVNFSGIDPNSSGFSVIDIPISDVTSFGLEVTVCYTWSTVIQVNGIDYAGKAQGRPPKPGAAHQGLPRRGRDY